MANVNDQGNGGQATGDEGQVTSRQAFHAFEDEEIVDGDIDENDDDYVSDDEDDDSFEHDEDDEVEDEESDEEEEESTDDQGQPQKRVQTPEENAFFAELRRQQEAMTQQQQMLQQFELMRKTQPDYQLAEALSRQYGTTPENLLQIVRDAQLQDEAAQRGMTPQQLMNERQLQAQQQQMVAQQQQLQFEAFKLRMEHEGAMLKNKYPSLGAEEFTSAVAFMLQNNATNMPLENAVRALHADRLYQTERNALKQDVLAEMSGRKKGIVPPQGGKAPKTTTLSSQERHFAKMMGISEADWIKHK